MFELRSQKNQRDLQIPQTLSSTADPHAFEGVPWCSQGQEDYPTTVSGSKTEDRWPTTLMFIRGVGGRLTGSAKS